MPLTFKNSFRFEYGSLDDGTYWIQAPSKKLVNINRDSLEVILKLNNGLTPDEVARICNVSSEEISELIKRMQKECVIVGEGKGKIAKAKPVKDIRVSPYVFLWIILALVQVWYFKFIARTYFMDKWHEGAIVLTIAIIATFGHELGHYIVSKKYFKPKFGFAFLFIFPALYVFTHESWKLPRGIRILINLSGSLVDLILNTFVIFLVLFSPKIEYYATPFLIIQFSRWALVLNPLFPTDFYWILSDVTKIVNLSQRAKENLFRLRPNLLSLYALLSYAFMGLALYWFGLFIVSIGLHFINAVLGR